MPRERLPYSQGETRFALGAFSGPATVSMKDVRHAMRKGLELFLRILPNVPSDRREEIGETHDRPVIRRNSPGPLF